MRKPKGNDQYVKAVEYSHTLEKLLIMERENSAALRGELEAAERERYELRAEQAEHDEQIARMESKFSLAKRALDSKTARCDRAEAELKRRDAAAGEPVAWRYRATNMFGDLLDAWKLSETKNQTGTCQPLYTTPPVASVNSPVIPEGWKIVPTELTRGMQNAWDTAPNCNKDDEDENMRNAYRTMIASAPLLAGWKLVPLEATADMLDASWKLHGIYHPSAYRTMISAAPTPGGDGG